MVHVVVPPETNSYVREPVPVPPVATTWSGLPTVPDVEVTVSPDCATRETRKVTSFDAAATAPTEAAVARTTQLPAPVNVNTPVELFTVQVVVVFETTE